MFGLPTQMRPINLRKKMPVVTYMGFSIHGNEPSGSNASVHGILHGSC